jgi:hypothetical protein
MENEGNLNEAAAGEQVEKAEKSKKSKRRNKNKKSSGEGVKTGEVDQQQQQEENDAVSQLANLNPDMLKQLKALNLDEMMKIGKEAAGVLEHSTSA